MLLDCARQHGRRQVVSRWQAAHRLGNPTRKQKNPVKNGFRDSGQLSGGQVQGRDQTPRVDGIDER